MQNNLYENLYITQVLLKSEPQKRETAGMGVQWRVRHVIKRILTSLSF